MSVILWSLVMVVTVVLRRSLWPWRTWTLRMVLIANHRLIVDTLILLVHRAVAAVVQPRVTLSEYHLVVSVQILWEVGWQMFCCYPTAMIQVVEDGLVDIIVEIKLWEIVVWGIVVACRSPRRLHR